jgi:hypothetical protein
MSELRSDNPLIGDLFSQNTDIAGELVHAVDKSS